MPEAVFERGGSFFHHGAGGVANHHPDTRYGDLIARADANGIALASGIPASETEIRPKWFNFSGIFPGNWCPGRDSNPHALTSKGF